MLADPSSRPSGFWNNALTLAGGRIAAAKTGTSNKDVSKGAQKKILPGDLWTAGYTPQMTTVVWAGNTDGSATLGTADGLNCAAPIWRDFMSYAHKGLPIEKFQKPDSVYSATISRISGRKATANTPENMRVTTLFAVAPSEFENSVKEIEIDSLCGGKVTDSTPQDAIKKGYLVSVSPIIESYNKSWLKGIQGSFTAGSTIPSGNILFAAPTEACERPGEGDSSISLATNIAEGAHLNVGNNTLEVSFKATNPVQKIQIYRDGELYRELVVDGKTEGRYVNNAFKLDDTWSGKHEITIKIVDKFLYSKSVSANITCGSTGTNSSDTTNNT